jgi:helix-turn-helix protein
VPTEEGRAAYGAVEEITDRLAGEVWDRLGSAATERLAELLRPLARTASALMPDPNPIGLPRLT